MRRTRNSTEACQTASCFMTSDLRHRQSFLNYLRKCDCINVLSHCCLSECPADFLVFVGSKEIHPCRKIANKQAASQTHGGNQALTDNPAFTFSLLSKKQPLFSLIVLPSGESDGESLPGVSVWCSRVQFLSQSGSQEETNHHHGPISKSDAKCCLSEKGRSQSGPTKDVHFWCSVPSWCITGQRHFMWQSLVKWL